MQPDGDEQLSALRGEAEALRQELARLAEKLGGLERRIDAAAAPDASMVPPMHAIASVEVRPDPTDIAAPPPVNAPEAEAPATPRKPPPLPPRAPLPVQPAAMTTTPPLAAPVDAPATAPPSPTPRKSAMPVLEAPRRWRIGPSEDMSWEMALGTWWLPRIGIAVLSVGVVYLLTLGIQRFGQPWMWPYLRVGIGYVICAVLLVAARRLEHTARSYARVLASGGFALSYFITYAAHFIPYTQIITSRTFDLALLMAIVLAWTALAQSRRSPLLGLGVTVLGHFTIALATLGPGLPAPFAVFSVFLFSLGGAFFLARNRWYAVGAASMLGAHANLFLLFARSEVLPELSALVTGLSLLAGIFLIFSLAEVFAPDDLRRRAVSLRFRSAYTTTNAAAAVFMSLLLFNAKETWRENDAIVWFGYGAALLALGLLYARRRALDPIHHLYLLKGLALLTVGLASWLDGPSLIVSLAAQALLLVFWAQRSDLLIPRLLSGLVALLALAAAALHAWPNFMQSLAHNGLAPVATFALATTYAAATLLLLAAAWRYANTPWSHADLDAPDTPGWVRLGARLMGVAVGGGGPHSARFTALFALVAASIASLGVAGFGGDTLRPILLLATFATLLGIAAPLLRLRAYVLAAHLAHATVVVLTWFALIGPEATAPGPLGLACIALFFLGLSEYARLVADPAAAFGAPGVRNSTMHAYAFAGGLIAYCAPIQATGALAETPGIALLALGFSAYGLVAAGALGPVALFGGLAAAAICILELLTGGTIASGLVLAPVMGMALLSERRYFARFQGLRYHQARPMPYALYGAATAIAWLWIWSEKGATASPWPMAGLSVLALALAWPLHARALSISALGVLIISTALFLLEGGQSATAAHATRDTLLLMAIALGAGLFEWRMRLASLLWLCPAWILLAWFTAHLYIQNGVAGAWGAGLMGLIAFLFAGYGLVLRAQTALLCSVVSAVVLIIGLFTFKAQGDTHDLHLIAGFGIAAAYTAAAERALRYLSTSSATADLSQKEFIGRVLALLAGGILVLMLSRLPSVRDYYLSITWTMLAVGLILFSLPTRQAYYRFAGLAVFALVLGRVFLVDTRTLDPMLRVLSVILLGVVMLVVAYGYIRARQIGGKTATPVAATPPPIPAPPPADESVRGADSVEEHRSEDHQA